MDSWIYLNTPNVSSGFHIPDIWPLFSIQFRYLAVLVLHVFH